MKPRRATEIEVADPVLEIIRESARANVERYSLRHVAAAIGMSHTGLAAFVAETNPSTPYGSVRERLYKWAVLTGLKLPEGSIVARVSESAPAYSARTAPRIPPRAYQLVYEYCGALESAGVPEEQIEEARRLMSGETFNTLRKHMADERDEEGWVKDVKAAWLFIKSQLKAQGYDL